MSWQLGSGLVLAAALAAGFGWYERARPDARIVALVGTLAAFAALGRIAFAAIPNVKPTTDIVLVAGYALGGGPGFAVGALAGLTSNFFFGQGPWTPWQMAAWGLTGVLGAGLAIVTGRRIGRWPLAVVGGVAGFAFTVVQDVGDWVTYSDHSQTQLWLYIGRGIGFDAVHAAGCVVFALAFGPALIRSLQRFARRLQVTWRDAEPSPRAAGAQRLAVGLVALVAGGLAGLGAPPGSAVGPGRAAAAPAPAAVIAHAAAYLEQAENPDGGFGAARGQPSAALFTGWAALGLAATGRSPLAAGPGGRSPIAAIETEPAGADVGALERTILVVRAAGLSPRRFGGRDLVAALLRHRRGDGSTAGTVNLTAFAVLALRAAGVAPAVRTLRWLAAQAGRDGGFGYAGGAPSDADDTGAVLEALAGSPGPRTTENRAVAFLRAAQNRDGGFPSQAGESSNAQSTAWAIQGLIAAGVDPATVHRPGGRSPVAYLLGLVAPDGSVRYARGQTQTPVWVTGEALMALAGRPLPLAPVAAPRARTPPGTPQTASIRAASVAHTHPAAGRGTAHRLTGRHRTPRQRAAGGRGGAHRRGAATAATATVAAVLAAFGPALAPRMWS